MKSKPILAFVLLLSILSTTYAASFSNLPEEGLWWNPNESGRGWSIEIQDNIIAVTHYVYDTGARATFFTSAGPWDGLGFTGALVSSQGGQCIGCPYVAPSNTSLGNVRFSFTSPLSGSVSYPNGVTIQIQRLVYGYSSPTQALLGAWTSSYGAFGSYLGEPLVLLTTFSTASIPFGIQGTVDGRSSQPAVFAPIQPGGNDIIGIVASSATFNTYYRFTRDRLNAWKGFACPYPASSTAPTTCSIPMIAHRWIGATAYRQLSEQQPGMEKQLATYMGYRNLALESLAQLNQASSTQPTATLSATAAELDRLVRELRTDGELDK